MNISEKHKALLKTGKSLFWKYGIKRVSIEEICKEASVSKMTFYKYFKNKNDFAFDLLRTMYKDALDKFETIVHAQKPISEKIQELFILKLEAAKDISMEMINDIFKSKDEKLQQLVLKSGQKSQQIFVDFLQDAQKKNLIRKDIKIDFILYYMQHATQMMEDPNLVSKYKHPHDLIMESMRFLFYGLSPKA